MGKEAAMSGFPATIITGYEHLTDEEVQELWDAGVCMDDWDYLILLPPSVLNEEPISYTDWETGKEKDGTRLTPVDYNLERMLTGCCSNKWYRAVFRGEERAIGVAYHS